MGMFDPDEFSKKDPAALFESLRQALTLNQLMSERDYQGAASFLRTCDPQLVGSLFERTRTCWDEFIRKMGELNSLLQVFGINQYAAMITLKDQIRPDLIAFARRLETQMKRGERLDGVAADTAERALSDAEAQRVRDLLGKSGLGNLMALFDTEETDEEGV